MYRSPDICENGRIRDFRIENSSKKQMWDDINKVLLANEARRRCSPPPQKSVQNFETFAYPRRVLDKPSRYGVVTQPTQIIAGSHTAMSHHHAHPPPPYTTKNAFAQTVVEAKPSRRVVAGGGSGGLVLNSGNFVVILIILLLLLAGSLAALTFMTFRYKKILEDTRPKEKPTQRDVIKFVRDDKCEKKGFVASKRDH